MFNKEMMKDIRDTKHQVVFCSTEERLVLTPYLSLSSLFRLTPVFAKIISSSTHYLVIHCLMNSRTRTRTVYNQFPYRANLTEPHNNYYSLALVVLLANNSTYKSLKKLHLIIIF